MLKVRASCVGGVKVPRSELDDWQRDARQWTVTLRYGRRRMSVPFFQGRAHTSEPTAADVLGCLLSDASCYDNARDLADFCADFGYDEDSRKAKTTYRACGRISKRLRQFLGDDFDAFSSMDEDDIANVCE